MSCFSGCRYVYGGGHTTPHSHSRRPELADLRFSTQRHDDVADALATKLLRYTIDTYRSNVHSTQYLETRVLSAAPRFHGPAPSVMIS